MAGFVALLDANVLVPVSLTDTLLRLAERDLFRPLWSDKILDETWSAILRVHPELTPGRVDARLRAMAAFEDSCVRGWEPLVRGIELPDLKDRHVVAAAIRGRAEVIVTRNLRHFPHAALEPLGLHAISPDDFLLDLYDLAPEVARQCLGEQAASTSRPPMSVDEVLNSLALAGAPIFADQMRTPGDI